jgi:tRNA(fMet)-specific endonuclease VapC
MPDAYLLDTSIASIAWDGGNKNHGFIRQRLASLGEGAFISICSISLAEVEYGLLVSPAADPERHAVVRNAMSQYKIWDIDRHTSTVYAQLRAELFKQYSPKDKRGRLTKKQPEELRDETTGFELGIQENDLWIVSVAVQYDLRFITQDEMRRIREVTRTVYSYDLIELWTLPSPSPGKSASEAPA